MAIRSMVPTSRAVMPFFLRERLGLAAAASAFGASVARPQKSKRLGAPLNRSRRWNPAGSYQHARSISPIATQPVR